MCEEEEYFFESLEKLRRQEEFEDYYADVMHDEMMIEKEQKMKREIIDLSTTNMTLEESMQLENYIWEGNYLIPVELLEGE